MERGREERWRLNWTHEGELKRKEKVRPRKSFILGEATSLYLVTITSKLPRKTALSFLDVSFLRNC